MSKKPLRVGLVGYGFMGRTHSNAFAKVSQFFDLPYRPGVAGGVRAGRREGGRVCRAVGLRFDRDRLAQAGGAARYRSDRHRQPERYACGDRHRRGRAREDGALREAAGPQCRRIRAHGGGSREGRRGEHGLVQLSARAGGDARQAVDRRRAAGQASSITARSFCRIGPSRTIAAGRRGPVAAGRARGGQRRDGRPAGALHRHGHVAERRDRPGDRHDRDVREGASARTHRARWRRWASTTPARFWRGFGTARWPRLKPRVTRAGTRRSTRWRSTASTPRSSGTCTICIAWSISTIAMKGGCGVGARFISPTATILI